MSLAVLKRYQGQSLDVTGSCYSCEGTILHALGFELRRCTGLGPKPLNLKKNPLNGVFI